MNVWVVTVADLDEGIFDKICMSEQVARNYVKTRWPGAYDPKECRSSKGLKTISWKGADGVEAFESEIEGYKFLHVRCLEHSEPPTEKQMEMLRRLDVEADRPLMILDPWEGYVSHDNGETFHRVHKSFMKPESFGKAAREQGKLTVFTEESARDALEKMGDAGLSTEQMIGLAPERMDAANALAFMAEVGRERREQMEGIGRLFDELDSMTEEDLAELADILREEE